MFFTFESDPDVIVADIHEGGRILYPGTGYANEAGNDEASGAKLNIPVMPNSAVDLSCGTQNALALSAFETARWDNQKGHCLNSERW